MAKELTLDEIYELEAKYGCTVGSSLWRAVPVAVMFEPCIDGRHDQCAVQSDKLYRDGRLTKCECECHKPKP